MSKAFTVQQIKDAAERYREIASKFDDVAASLSKINPGVLIVIGEQGAENGEGGLARIKSVLKEAGKPLTKKEIVKRMDGKIKEDTLTSYLSRNRAMFDNPKRGHWTLAKEK